VSAAGGWDVEKLPAVETATLLMTEAVVWSVMKWLREKKKVRKAADLANAALDQANHAAKKRWPADIRAAYETLANRSAGNIKARDGSEFQSPANAHAILAARKVKKADDEAQSARIDAEQTFDIAEKHLSTALAREGCRKAIHSWELHEKAIRMAEALIEVDPVAAG